MEGDAGPRLRPPAPVPAPGAGTWSAGAPSRSPPPPPRRGLPREGPGAGWGVGVGLAFLPLPSEFAAGSKPSARYPAAPAWQGDASLHTSAFPTRPPSSGVGGCLKSPRFTKWLLFLLKSKPPQMPDHHLRKTSPPNPFPLG